MGSGLGMRLAGRKILNGAWNRSGRLADGKIINAAARGATVQTDCTANSMQNNMIR